MVSSGEYVTWEDFHKLEEKYNTVKEQLSKSARINKGLRREVVDANQNAADATRKTVKALNRLKTQRLDVGFVEEAYNAAKKASEDCASIMANQDKVLEAQYKILNEKQFPTMGPGYILYEPIACKNCPIREFQKERMKETVEEWK